MKLLLRWGAILGLPIAVVAMMAIFAPSGVNAAPKETLRVDLRLNSYSQTESSLLSVAVVDGEVRLTNYVTESAHGVNVTNKFTIIREGDFMKVLLSGVFLDGWLGNSNEPVTPQSASAFWCQTAGIMIVGQNGAKTIDCKEGLHENLDQYGLNDQLDWVMLQLRPLEPTPTDPATATPVPTFVRIYATGPNTFKVDGSYVNMLPPQTISLTLENGTVMEANVVNGVIELPKSWASFRTGAGLTELIPTQWASTNGAVVFKTYHAHGPALYAGSETNSTPSPRPVPTSPPIPVEAGS